MVPVDIHTYFFDLEEANKLPADVDSAAHVWKKLYDFKTDYGLSDMSPSSINGLLKDLSTNPDLINQF